MCIETITTREELSKIYNQNIVLDFEMNPVAKSFEEVSAEI